MSDTLSKNTLEKEKIRRRTRDPDASLAHLSLVMNKFQMETYSVQGLLQTTDTREEQERIISTTSCEQHFRFMFLSFVYVLKYSPRRASALQQHSQL